MKYIKYAFIRILLLIPTFLGVSFILWFVLNVLYKGDPLAPYIGNPLSFMKMSLAERQALRVKYGLDKPWLQRYIASMINILTGNWGTSARYNNAPISFLVQNSFYYTAVEIIGPIILALIIGIILGIRSSVSTNKKDFYISTTSLIGFSVPAFILAIFIKSVMLETYFFIADVSGQASFFNSVIYSGAYNPNVYKYPTHLIFGLPLTHFVVVDSLLALRFSLFFDALLHLLGPDIIIFLAILPYIIKITRNSMMATLREDYIILAKSKGLKERTILYKHAFKNALVPIMTITGTIFTTILVSSLFAEIVFNYPGLGLFLYQGIQYYDLNIIQGYVIFTTLLFVFYNLVVDLCYPLIDPRIKLT